MPKNSGEHQDTYHLYTRWAPEEDSKQQYRTKSDNIIKPSSLKYIFNVPASVWLSANSIAKFAWTLVKHVIIQPSKAKLLPEAL